MAASPGQQVVSTGLADGERVDSFYGQVKHVAEYWRYLPGNLATAHAEEAKARGAWVLKRLSIEPCPPSAEELDRTLDRLEAFEDMMYPTDMDFCVDMSLSLWRLLLRCAGGSEGGSSVPYGHALRRALAQRLGSWLRAISTRHVPPVWLKRTFCEKRNASLQRLLSELDIMAFVRMMIGEMSRSQRIGYAVTQAECTVLVRDLEEVCNAMRNFLDAAAVAQVQNELANQLDGHRFHVMLFARLLVVLTPRDAAAGLIASGRLWEWWSAVPESLVPKFDLMWFAILGRFAKQRWAGALDDRPDELAAADKALRKQLPWILNKAYRTISLPLCSPSASGLDCAKEMMGTPAMDRYTIPQSLDASIMGRKTNWRKVTKLIAYLLDGTPPKVATPASGADAVSDDVWSCLALLLRQLVPFMRPGSAYGEWQVHGVTILQHLVKSYYKRAGRERCLETTVPQERCLSRTADERFVGLVLPLVSSCLWTANSMATAAALECIGMLSQLAATYSPPLEDAPAPEPFMLDMASVFSKAAEALSDPARSGQHATLLQLFGRALPAIMLRWPSFLNSLLPVVLWGIDVTDLPKTLSSLVLTITLFTSIPCLDTDEWPSTDPSARAKGNELRWPAPSGGAGRDPSCDNDSVARMVSSMLPSFVEDYFGRIFEFIGAMPKPTKAAGGIMDEIESACLKLLHTTTHLLASQCAISTYTQVLEALKDFLMGGFLLDQIKAVVAVASAIVRANPSMAVPHLLPPLLKKLGAVEGATSLRADLSESEAKWLLSLVIGVCRHGAPTLVRLPAAAPLLPQVEAAMRGALADEREDVVKLGAKLLRRLTFGLTATYVLNDFRVCSSKTWEQATVGQSAEARAKLRWWGWTAPWWANEPPSIEWHMPSEKEIGIAKYLVEGALACASKLLPWGGEATEDCGWLSTLVMPKKKKASHGIKVGMLLAQAGLRGCNQLWPDERTADELQSSLLPRVASDVGTTPNATLFEPVAAVLLGTLRTLSMEERDKGGLPPGIESIEVPGLLGKVFDCLSELLRSPGRAGFADSGIFALDLRSGQSGMLFYFVQMEHPPIHLLHEESRWRMLPRFWWCVAVTDVLDVRHDELSNDHPFKGWRKEILEDVLELAIRASSGSVREIARHLVAESLRYHPGAAMPLLKDGILPALEGECKAVFNCGTHFGEVASKEDLRLNGTLDGIARLLEEDAFASEGWHKGVDEAAQIAVVLAEGIYAVTRSSADGLAAPRDTGEPRCEVKATTMKRLVRSTQRWIERREAQCVSEVRPDSATFTPERTVKALEAIAKLLDICERQESHWRAQATATALVMALRCALRRCHAPPEKQQYAKELWLRWLAWVLRLGEPKKVVPVLHSLGVQSLLWLLKRPAPLTNDDLFEAGLFNMEVASKLLEVLPRVHHASLLNTGESSGHSTDPMEKTMKLMIASPAYSSWPGVWASRSSAMFSVSNALFWQSYFSAAARVAPQEFLEALMDKACEFLSAKPVAEAEYHLALAEFSAGMFRALRKDEYRDKLKNAWGRMRLTLWSEIQKGSLDRLGEWCDALRFVAAGSAPQLLRAFLATTGGKPRELPSAFLVPLLNFALNPEVEPDMQGLTSSSAVISTLGGPDEDATSVVPDLESESSSLSIFKRLRMVLALLLEPSIAARMTQDEPFCRGLFESLRGGLGHPYKQLREEAARSVVILRLAVQGTAYNQRMQTIGHDIEVWLGEEAQRLLPLLTKDRVVAEEGDVETTTNKGRKRHVLESSGLCYVLLHAGLDRLSACLLSEAVPRCVGFLLAAATHGDFELRALATSALGVCSASNLPSPYAQGVRPWRSIPMGEELARLLRGHAAGGSGTLSFKELEKAYFMSVRPMIVANAFVLRCLSPPDGDGQEHFDLLAELRGLVEGALSSSKHEVRRAAKGALTSIMMTDRSEAVLQFLVKCRQKARNARLETASQDTAQSDLVGGVLGLSCALCVAADVGSPPWVGQAVESLAPYGRSSMPDVMRKEVQGTFQMFLKVQQSMQQSWKEFQEKLTRNQLDLLNEYKGKLTYFS